LDEGRVTCAHTGDIPGANRHGRPFTHSPPRTGETNLAAKRMESHVKITITKIENVRLTIYKECLLGCDS
jgi:hypothetical protein